MTSKAPKYDSPEPYGDRKGTSPRRPEPPGSRLGLPSPARTGQEERRGAAGGGSGNFPVPVFIGEHPLTVLALIDLSISKTFLLDLLIQGLVEGADGVAGVLLVSSQVEL